jgi:hypothetical protein
VNVLALCNDMIFRTKIESTARSLGCNVVRNVDALGDDSGEDVLVVLIDLDSAWPGAQRVVSTLSRKRLVRVVAFGSHVRADLFAEARAAGISEVMARSAFVTKLPTILGTPGDESP